MNEQLILNIANVTGEGVGVARHNGLAIFVPGTLPDEKVRVKVTNKKKKFWQASLTEIIEPSPLRQQPTCPWQQECGGCVWQHTSYAAELEYKRDNIQQTLRRIGGINIQVEPVWASESPFGYRDRVVWHVDHSQGLKIGLYQQHSHSLCLCDCQLLREPLPQYLPILRSVLAAHEEELQALRAISLRRNDISQTQLVFITDTPISSWETILQELYSAGLQPLSLWENSGNPVYGVYGAKWRHLEGEEYLTDTVLGKKLLVSAGSFQQVNRPQAEKMYDYVVKLAAPDKSCRVLDLYSGLGCIGLLLSDYAKEVVSVESFAPAVKAAKAAAQLNKVENITMITAPAEQALPKIAAQGPIDSAVLDPPRAGCDPQLLQTLAEAAPERIVYVSCSPSTLARDLRLLTEYGYQPVSVQPVDMFSRTGHVENICLLSRKNKLEFDGVLANEN